MNTENRRADIYSVSFVKPSQCSMIMLYNKGIAIVNGIFTKINGLQKINFDENSDWLGISTTQKFNAIASDTSQSNRIYLESLCGIPLILKVDYSNGVSKVIGSIDRPILLTFSIGGNPTAYTLTFQRIDKGSAPIYQSFS
ncbi:MAG: hypothetical protein PHV20_12425 [Bacteroidales bacterium]|nr:hypothetical protein [Bacteroidales bacterium]